MFLFFSSLLLPHSCLCCPTIFPSCYGIIQCSAVPCITHRLHERLHRILLMLSLYSCSPFCHSIHCCHPRQLLLFCIVCLGLFLYVFNLTLISCLIWLFSLLLPPLCGCSVINYHPIKTVLLRVVALHANTLLPLLAKPFTIPGPIPSTGCRCRSDSQSTRIQECLQ